MKLVALFLTCLMASPIALSAQERSSEEKDPAMESKIRQAWSDARQYSKRRQTEAATDVDDPRASYAEEFFAYYRKHPGTPTGMKAGESAFMMWSSIGATEEIEAAVQQLPSDSELWSRILTTIGNAYGPVGQWDDYIHLLERKVDGITHPRSRSEMLLRLATQYRMVDEQPDKARAYYGEVVRLEAHPFDVQKAEGALWEMTSLNTGQAAPDFTARTIDGNSITLFELRGKVVLLEFWATNCGPCMPEIPHLRTLNDSLSDSGLQVIGITKDKDLEKLKQFLGAKQMTWPQVQQLSEFEDEVLKQDEVLVLYNVYWIPRSFLIDQAGIIAAKDLRGNDLEEAARKLVARGSE